jgi:hypothetical protein
MSFSPHAGAASTADSAAAVPELFGFAAPFPGGEWPRGGDDGGGDPAAVSRAGLAAGPSTVVSTQKELDRAMADPDSGVVVVRAPKGRYLIASLAGGHDIVAAGQSHVCVIGGGRERAGRAAGVDSARVDGDGHMTITLRDRATAKVGGPATLFMRDDTTAWAKDNANVDAGDHARLFATGDAAVTAWGHARVTAQGYASVDAVDNVAVTVKSDTARVALRGGAHLGGGATPDRRPAAAARQPRLGL